MANKEILPEARQRFRYVCDVEADQRRRETEDLRFQVPELQWDERARRERLGNAQDGVPTPPRPILSIPKLEQPISLVLNQMRSAHLGVNIDPISPDADDDMAEVYQGIYRRIERDSQAQIPRLWAANRAVRAGRGWYRIGTRYCDDPGGDPFDQEIVIQRILHQESVYIDPAAQEADFSDAQWAFVASWIPKETFKRVYPNTDLPSEDEFVDQEEEEPLWVTGGEEGDSTDGAVRVAEYFWITYDREELGMLSTGETVSRKSEKEPWTLDGQPLPKGAVLKRDLLRTRKVPRVMWAKVTGSEILEGPLPWNGKYIPLIPVLGRELLPFDEQRRFQGMIGPARDAQRLYNYAASGAVEMAALEPKAPWIAAEGQIENRESEWQQSNIRNLALLQYKPKTDGAGHALPPPQRAPVDTGRLGPNMLLLQQASDFIQAATHFYDPSLGKVGPERSGKAIQALQQEGDVSNSDWMYQLSAVAIAYEARVILDMIPRVYDRKARIVRILKDDEKTSEVLLNHPYVINPQTSRPEPVQMSETGEAVPPVWAQRDQPPPKPKVYDLAKGLYGVNVSVGRSFQTRMQEGSAALSNVVETAPDLLSLIGDLVFKYQDFPGAKELSDRFAKLREKQYPGLTEKAGEMPTPQEAMARVQTMEQQLQGMQQELQASKMENEVQAAKQEATLAKARLDNATKLEVEHLRGQIALLKVRQEQGAEIREGEAQREHEAAQLEREAAADLTKEVTRAAIAPIPPGTGPNGGQEAR